MNFHKSPFFGGNSYDDYASQQHANAKKAKQKKKNADTDDLTTEELSSELSDAIVQQAGAEYAVGGGAGDENLALLSESEKNLAGDQSKLLIVPPKTSPTAQLFDLQTYESKVEPWKQKKQFAANEVAYERQKTEDEWSGKEKRDYRKHIVKREKAEEKIASIEKELASLREAYKKHVSKKKGIDIPSKNKFENDVKEQFDILNEWIQEYNRENEFVLNTHQKSSEKTKQQISEYNLPLKDVSKKISAIQSSDFLDLVKNDKTLPITTKKDISESTDKLIRMKQYFPEAASYNSFEDFKNASKDKASYYANFVPTTPYFGNFRQVGEFIHTAAYEDMKHRISQFEELERIQKIDPSETAFDLIKSYVDAQFAFLSQQDGNDLNTRSAEIWTGDIATKINLPTISDDQKRLLIHYASEKTDMKASERYYLQLFMQYFLKDLQDYKTVFGTHDNQVTPEKMLELTDNKKIVDDYYKLSKKDNDKEYFNELEKGSHKYARKNQKTANLDDRSAKIEADEDVLGFILKYTLGEKEDADKIKNKRVKLLNKRVDRRTKKGYSGSFDNDPLFNRGQVVATQEYTENTTRRVLQNLSGEIQIKKGKYPTSTKEHFPQLWREPITEEMVTNYKLVSAIQTNPAFQSANLLLDVNGITPDTGNTAELNEAKLDYFKLIYGADLAKAQADFGTTPFGDLLNTVNSVDDLVAANFNGVDVFLGIPPEFKSNGWPVNPDKFIFDKLKSVFKAGYEKPLKSYGEFLLRDKTDYPRKLQWPSYNAQKIGDKFKKHWYLTAPIAAGVVAYPMYNIFKDFDFNNSEGMLLNDLTSLTNIAGGFLGDDGIKILDLKFGNDYTLGSTHYDQTKLKGNLGFGNRQFILDKNAMKNFNAGMHSEREKYSAPFSADFKFNLLDGSQSKPNGNHSHELNVSSGLNAYMPNPTGAYHGVTAADHFLKGDLKDDAKPDLKDYTNLLFNGTHDANPAQFPATTTNLFDYKAAANYKYAYRDFSVFGSADYLSLNKGPINSLTNQANRFNSQLKFDQNFNFDKTHSLSLSSNNTFSQTNIAGASQTNQFTTSLNSSYVGQPSDKSSEFKISLGGTYTHTQIKNMLTQAVDQKDVFGISSSLGFKLDPSFLKNNVDQLELRLDLSSADLSKPLETAQFKLFLIVRPRFSDPKASKLPSGF